MPKIHNWSAKTSNSFAYARAGKRRERILRIQLELVERRIRLLHFCVENNYPFIASARTIHKEFLKSERAKNPNYTISYWCIFYDLQAIFGKDYNIFYKNSALINDFDYPLEILEKLEETKKSGIFSKKKKYKDIY